MPGIIDIGFLVEPRQVRLVEGGTVYKLPPDVPVPLMLALEHYADAEITTDLVEDLYGQVLALFQVYQPDLDRVPIGLTQLMTLVRRVYAAEEEEVPPPKPKRAGGTRNTKRPPKRSRSSS